MKQDNETGLIKKSFNTFLNQIISKKMKIKSGILSFKDLISELIDSNGDEVMIPLFFI